MGQFQSSAKVPSFHEIHGVNIDLVDDCAVRLQNTSTFWFAGLVFSSESIRINQKICIKLPVISANSHDVISVGFTSRNPAHLYYLETEDTKTSWTCTLSRYFCTEDSFVVFHVDKNGVIHFGKNKTEFTVNKEVDVTQRLWAVVRIWSEPTTVKFVSESEVKWGETQETKMWKEPGKRETRDVGVSPEAAPLDEVCVICCNESVEVAFVPCGHLCACFDCGQTIENRIKLCPICRRSFSKVMRIYKS